MKNIFILGLAILLLSACDNSGSGGTTAATGTATPSCEGGGCGNGGGDEDVAKVDFKDTPYQENADEDTLTMDLHIADNLNYNWKLSTNTLIEDVDFFTQPRLLFTKLHTQNRNYYFYLYIEPQVSKETSKLTSVYKVALKRSQKAPAELTERDVKLLAENPRLLSTPELPSTGAIPEAFNDVSVANDTTREFWTTQKLGVQITTDSEELFAGGYGVFSPGPKNSTNFRNLMRLNENSILIRGDVVDKSITKLDEIAKDDADLSTSAMVPDFGPLSYIVEFKFNTNEAEVEVYGDISSKLEEYGLFEHKK